MCRRILGTIVTVLCVVEAPALAQTALGDGRALNTRIDTRQGRAQADRQQAASVTYDPLGGGRVLDNSLNALGRFNPTAQDQGLRYRLRNAIVTGNAPNGLSFRGDVGYTAPGEFRGDLASDSTFAFRRDSLYSGLGGLGIRGTDALQYQFALTTGSAIPSAFISDLAVGRGGSAYFAPAPGVRNPATINRTGFAPGLASGLGRASEFESEEGPTVGSLRSTAAFTSDQTLRPVLLGRIEATQDQVRPLTASPLRGVRIGPPQGEDGAPRLETGMSTQAQAGRVETAYSAVLAQIAARQAADAAVAADAESAEDEAARVLERVQRLRERVSGAEERPAEDQGQDRGGGLPDPLERSDDEEDEDPAPGNLRFDPETLRLLRDSGDPIDHLVDPNVSENDLFVNHMRAGERWLGEGRYFDAEERFTRALAIRPGDPSAQVGRIHAQLGAGLFLSAGMNLRELLAERPEVVGARYGRVLLPAPARIASLRTRLRANIGLTERDADDVPPTSRIRRESALLLAYIGHQTGSLESVQQGLGELARQVREPGAGLAPVDVRLLDLLREIWLIPGSDGGG